jgi:predicted RNA-binding protein with PUA-like domain
MAGMQYWLVKQEPEDFSYSDLVKDGRTAWTGVRNFLARNNLRSMKKSDLVLYYHTGSSKEVVGITRVEKEYYPDPTASEGDWVAVDLVPVAAMKKPVSLADIKADTVLKAMALVRQGRLSVSGLTEEQFKRLLALAETKVP